MEVLVGKDLGHLADEAVHELVGGLFCRVDHRCQNPVGMYDSEGPFTARECRVPREPTGRMTGNVKLRHNPDPATACIFDDVAHLGLRIELSVGSKLLQSREFLALD